MRRLITTLIAHGWSETRIRALLSLQPQSRVTSALNAIYRSTMSPTAQRLDAAHAAHCQTPTDASHIELSLATIGHVEALIRPRRLSDPDEVAGEVLYHLTVTQRRDESVPLSAWVSIITRNKVNDAIHRARRERERMSLDRVDDHVSPISADDMRVIDALPGVTDADKALIRQFLERPDYEVLSRELGVTTATLRRRLTRLTQKIVANRVAFCLSETTYLV